MTAAIALSIVLVIGVAGVSLAMQTQRPAQTGRPRVARPQPTVRRPARERRAPQAPASTPPPEAKANEPRGPELLRLGTAAPAAVLGVVDERTTGSIVRSRLNLRVEPGEGKPFEVTVRHVFPTLDARSRVRVGGKVLVRFDPDDHSRVVIAPEEPPTTAPPKAPGAAAETTASKAPGASPETTGPKASEASPETTASKASGASPENTPPTASDENPPPSSPESSAG